MERNAGKLAKSDDADFRAVIGTAEGMRFVAYLIDVCGANQQSFDPAAGDVNGALFREGRRSIGLMLLATIHAQGVTQAAYYQAAMEREHLRRRDSEDLRLDLAIQQGLEEEFDGNAG